MTAIVRISVFILDRDDLGQSNDTLEVAGRQIANPLNQEVVSIRGLLPGEYVVNVHLYRDHERQTVPATVKVEKLNPTVQLVYYGEVELAATGDERTAVRFTLAPDGTVVDVNRLPKRIVPLGKIAAGPAGAGR
jgi:hypothetical protein